MVRLNNSVCVCVCVLVTLIFSQPATCVIQPETLYNQHCGYRQQSSCLCLRTLQYMVFMHLGLQWTLDYICLHVLQCVSECLWCLCKNLWVPCVCMRAYWLSGVFSFTSIFSLYLTLLYPVLFFLPLSSVCVELSWDMMTRCCCAYSVFTLHNLLTFVQETCFLMVYSFL